jgi:hypothetical protein
LACRADQLGGTHDIINDIVDDDLRRAAQLRVLTEIRLTADARGACARMDVR